MKEKRRSNDKRKERSRDAARNRRSREMDIFTELAKLLPIFPHEAEDLDKASIMRLTIAYLKTRSVVKSFPDRKVAKDSLKKMDELLLKALDGFILILSSNGNMIYLSPNVKNYLGIPQLDLIGQSVFEYSHPCDHEDIRKCFPSSTSQLIRPLNFFLRLKCTLTTRGRKVNLKSASYRVIHCISRHVVDTIKKHCNRNIESERSMQEYHGYVFIVATPIPHPSNIEVPLGKYTFLSKHSLNMKFTYADDKLMDFFGWESNELLGQSIFDFNHALDISVLDTSFKLLFRKGQCETIAYRFLNKRGGYAWVLTQAALIQCAKQQKPLSVVCVNYLLSGIENETEVYSTRQVYSKIQEIIGVKKTFYHHTAKLQSCVGNEKPDAIISSLFRWQDSDKCGNLQSSPDGEKLSHKPGSSKMIHNISSKAEPSLKSKGSVTRQLSGRQFPQTTTASIFAPRTKDMNKGFLTFSEEIPGLTILKDEPDDLTHLAPTAGDVCVPLDDPTVFPDDFEELICCNSAETSNLSCGLPLLIGLANQDGDHTKKCNCIARKNMSGVTSPGISNTSKILDRLEDIKYKDKQTKKKFTDTNHLLDDDEFIHRAPYIPMSDQDETLQLLINEDMLMWETSPSIKETHNTASVQSFDKEDSRLYNLLSDEIKLNADKYSQITSGKQRDHSHDVNPTQDSKTGKDTSNKRIHSSTSKFTAEKKRAKDTESSLITQILSEPKNVEASIESAAPISVTNSKLWAPSEELRTSREYADCCDNGSYQQILTVKQQKSKSVLKNLLISGRDATAGYFVLEK